MKEASGEASNTVVVIILIAAILAAATLIVTNLVGRVNTTADSIAGQDKADQTEADITSFNKK